MTPELAPDLVPAVVGGTAGFIGGTVTALMKDVTVRKSLAAVLGGAGIGTFIAPVFVHGLTLPVESAGVIGLCGGVGVFGVLAATERIAIRMIDNLETLLPGVFRDRTPTPPTSAPGSPSSLKEKPPPDPSIGPFGPVEPGEPNGPV
jgi:hypothetical protein